METTYYLFQDDGKPYVYMVSELKKPHAMDVGILDTWIQEQNKDFSLLPFGCSNLHVGMKPENYVMPIQTKKCDVEILEVYKVESDKDKPLWLRDFTPDLSQKVDRIFLIGDPSIYTHLIPLMTYGVEKSSKQSGIMERVLVTGCFDLLHAGHVHFLKEVHKQYVGEYRELHVGLPDDTSYGYLKGRRPIYPFAQRKSVLEALQYVDEVHEFEIWSELPIGHKYPQNGHRYLLDKVKPVLFVDSRQKPKEDIGASQYLKDKGIPIRLVDSINIHTTDIIKRIKE